MLSTAIREVYIRSIRTKMNLKEKIKDFLSEDGCAHEHEFVKDLGLSFCVFSQNYHNYQLYRCVKCGAELRHHDLNGKFYDSIGDILQEMGLDNIEVD